MQKTNRLLYIFILAVIMFALPTSEASARLARCRIDPHFKLSNGDMVTVTLDIGTDIANVRNINYILHVPPGVTITKVTYTAKSDKKAINETYLVYQDSPAKTYITDTVVTTQNPDGVEVIVFARVNGAPEKSVSGYNGQHLFISLSRP